MTPDSQLLDRAREFDARALAEIYDRYAESIYRYLYRYLGDEALAEDLTSEVFVKLLQVLGTSRAPRDRLRGWLYRVAHNLAMDWFRQQARSPAVSLNEDYYAPEQTDLVAESELPSLAFERNQTRQRLRTAISRLTEAQQQVILFRFGEGLKIGEVAELMGKSEGAIKILQHRAVKRLQKLLEAEE